ncbi:peptidoglycan-binding protein LysM [Litoreibacter roseus]|uniref:Peptidoglycan-binding protein LysM n=2 Tax=Litoreibacter roseus TaxID=2601869 RepID=A0A6N6JEY0_9RHOB|nr:peptidoglycan-binding protein LysM [Litoreibacter roseus]
MAQQGMHSEPAKPREGMSAARIGAGIFLALVLLGFGVVYLLPAPEREVTGFQPPEGSGTALVEAPASETASVNPPAAPDQSELAEASQPAPESAPEIPEQTLRAPTLDLVRVDQAGAAVIAGTAEKNRPVVIFLDGETFAEVQSDATGKFVALFDIPASEAARTVSIATVDADGAQILSDATVLLAPVMAQITPPMPTEPEQVDIAEAEGAPELPDVSQLADAVQEDARADEAEPVSPSAPEPLSAPAVVVADSDGVDVIRPAPQPKVVEDGVVSDVANVVIDTISYDNEGEVALSGRGGDADFVRVYLNDRPVKTAEIQADGTWDAPLVDVDAGVYRLRVDEIGLDGKVTSRVETPFQREEIEIAQGAVSAVTVQTGFTLWGIAQEQFGDGVQYVRVYEANRELIRDPNLIYPGQIFTLPTE